MDQRHGLHVDADNTRGARGPHGRNKRRHGGLRLPAIHDVPDRHDARLAQVAPHPLGLLVGHPRDQPQRQLSLVRGDGRQRRQGGWVGG